jgi:hypothetical protein
LPASVRASMNFVLVNDMFEVLAAALEPALESLVQIQAPNPPFAPARTP